MKVFISYRRDDIPGEMGRRGVGRRGVDRLFDHLEAQYGRGLVFLDVDSSMPLGVDFREHIAARVEKTDAVLVVIGPRWLELIREKMDDPEDFVRLEIEAALEKDKPVVPVLMGADVQMLAEEELPPSISKLAYLKGMPVDVGADFRHHVHKLCSKLEASVPGSVPQPSLKPRDPVRMG